MPTMQLEAIQHLAQAADGILRMDEGAVRQFRVLEQADVATEQDAMFVARKSPTAPHPA
jgi:hypothetical protein